MPNKTKMRRKQILNLHTNHTRFSILCWNIRQYFPRAMIIEMTITAWAGRDSVLRATCQAINLSNLTQSKNIRLFSLLFTIKWEIINRNCAENIKLFLYFQKKIGEIENFQFHKNILLCPYKLKINQQMDTDLVLSDELFSFQFHLLGHKRTWTSDWNFKSVVEHPVMASWLSQCNHLCKAISKSTIFA